MRIQLLSDLHLEFNLRDKNTRKAIIEEMSISPHADVLVLAGDVANYKNINLIEFLEYGKSDKPILYVPGNHEYYGGDIHTSGAEIEEYFKKVIPNLVYMDERSHVIDDVMFAGATLWTSLSDRFKAMMAAKYLNDFRQIEGLDLDVYDNTFQRHRSFLRNTLKDTELKKKVVLTHHCPTYQDINPKYKGDDLNVFFCSNLDSMFEKEETAPQLWFHGHQHDPRDKKYGHTRLVSNPYGYPNENHRFQKHLLAEI